MPERRDPFWSWSFEEVIHNEVECKRYGGIVPGNFFYWPWYWSHAYMCYSEHQVWYGLPDQPSWHIDLQLPAGGCYNGLSRMFHPLAPDKIEPFGFKNKYSSHHVKYLIFSNPWRDE